MIIEEMRCMIHDSRKVFEKIQHYIVPMNLNGWTSILKNTLENPQQWFMSF